MEPFCPEPGIYETVPLEKYLEWDAISNSRLALARRSMAHFNCPIDRPSSDAMRFGSLVHSGRLEPLNIPLRYVVLPDYGAAILRPDGTPYANPKATKEYKTRVFEFQEMNAGKEIVDQDTYDRLIGLVTAVDANERAREYLNGNGKVEVSVVWDCPKTGLRCKGRLDKWNLDSARITDLKTTRDAGDFERSIARFGYYRQGAFYTWGLTVLTGIEHEFCIVAVESEAPFGVRAAPLSAEALKVGQVEVAELLQTIQKCRATDTWPGYDSPDAWDLPEWAQPKEEPVTIKVGGQAVAV